jgi:signal peptidase I
MRVRPIAKVLMVLTLMGCVAGISWAWGSGYRVYSVRSSSMQPAYHYGDAVVVKPIGDAVRTGDVINFHNPIDQQMITRRVVSIEGDRISTKADGNDLADNWTITRRLIVGRVVARAPFVGYAMVFLKQSVGLGGLVALVLAGLLLYQITFPEKKEDTTITIPTSVPLYFARPEPKGVEYAITQDEHGRRHVLAVSRQNGEQPKPRQRV